jgi:hypothetical protein
MAVEVLAGPVVTHRGARVGVAGGDLDVPQVYSSIKHGRDEGMPEHVGVRPGSPHSRGLGEASEAPGGNMAIHPVTAAVEQNRPAGTASGCLIDDAADGWWQRVTRSCSTSPMGPCWARYR